MDDLIAPLQDIMEGQIVSRRYLSLFPHLVKLQLCCGSRP